MKVVVKQFGGGVSFDDLPSGAVYRNEPGSEHLFMKLVLPQDGTGACPVYQIHLNNGQVCRPPTIPLVWPVAGAFVEE